MLRPKQAMDKVSFFKVASQINALQAPPQTGQASCHCSATNPPKSPTPLALAQTSTCCLPRHAHLPFLAHASSLP